MFNQHSVHMEHIDDFVGGTLVRSAPNQMPEGFKAYHGESLPATMNHAKGTIVRLEREAGRVRILTDNDDLKLCVTETKMEITPGKEGEYVLKPGWTIVADYYLCKPGQSLPESLAKYFG